ncbi:MAG: prolyl oligopeptidase family serine peptidase [Halobacteriaceae archaeon]
MSEQFGEWESPISSQMIASDTLSFGGVVVDNGDVWWLERRPNEGGRGVLVRWRDSKAIADITPSEYNVRTLVHEYGGGDFYVHNGTAWFVNYDDQRIYRQAENQSPTPITPEPTETDEYRYADMELTPNGERLYCVREHHGEDQDEPTNELVRLSPDGENSPTVVETGHDFYSFPRVDPSGTKITWTSWDHPNMPWDATTLHMAEIDGSGDLYNKRSVIDNEEESIFQPSWSPSGVLHFVSDRSNWWNIYAVDNSDIQSVYREEAEFGSPQWGFDLSTYTFLPDGRIVAIKNKRSTQEIGVISDGEFDPLDIPLDIIPRPYLKSDEERIAFIAGDTTHPISVVTGKPDDGFSVIKKSVDLDVDTAYISEPEHIEFPTSNGETAYGLYYPPTHPTASPPDNDQPPLVVLSHGGPTGQTFPILSISGPPSIQFLTSRGFAVVDVNYRGSTGYGRNYRDRLKGNWGILDVEDCIRAAEYLIEHRNIDPNRVAIEGGSAGGYATLCGVTFHNAFDAGVSHYGVADVKQLAENTHKFESRYLDSLIGPLPDAEDEYRERSPVHHAERIRCPLLLLQGGEDKVVPPSQAKAMRKSLSENDVPHGYLEFPEEQHGFRKAESRKRASEAELSFYSQVFDFEPADSIPHIEVSTAYEKK